MRAGRSNTTFPKPKDRYALTSELKVSPFCIGATADPKTVVAAYDAGINFFFLTADMHWPIYEGLRRGLAMLFERGGGVRDDVVVGVVSYVTQREFTFAPFLEVIQAVPKLERIELTIMGGTYGPDFIVRRDPFMNHRKGVIPGAKAIGASFHDRPAALTALNHAMIDIGFVRYNPDHPGAGVDLYPHLAADRKPLLYNFNSTFRFVSPQRCDKLGLPPDQWRPSVTDYYRFALTQPAVDGLLCAPHQPSEVEGLVNALEAGPLTDEETEYLRDLADLSAGRASL